MEIINTIECLNIIGKQAKRIFELEEEIKRLNREINALQKRLKGE